MAINLNSKIYVAGHTGMVGSAIVNELKSKGYRNVIYQSRHELDLLNQNDVEIFFRTHKPSHVFISAAKVGGIYANDNYRAQFLYENLQIQNNLIHFAHKYEVEKLLFLGSSCIYPKECNQPIKEEYLLTGELENTNEPYALAKIAGIKMCETYAYQYSSNFYSAMPTNLYGPNDNFDLKMSHVIPALISKFHDSMVLKKDFVEIWGSGKPLREFLYVNDLANACVFLMEEIESKDIYSQNISQINVGSNIEISIMDLALKIKEVIGYGGNLKFDSSKPDGTMRKIIDSSRINSFGWKSSTSLSKGLKKTYDWYIKNNF